MTNKFAFRLRIVGFMAVGIMLCSLIVQGQSTLQKIAFSVLNGEQITHIAQISLQDVNGEATIVSSINVTQEPGVLRLDPGQRLERTLFLGNETEQAQSFSVLLLLDDVQVELTLDGKNSKVHEINVDAMSSKRLGMSFPSIDEQGLHKFLLLVFYDITVFDKKKEGLFVPYDNNLMVGGGSVPDVTLARPDDGEFLQGEPLPRLTMGKVLPPVGISLSRREMIESDQDLLQSPLTASSGQDVSYFTLVRNGRFVQSDAEEYVFVVLWDGLQVSVNDQTEGEVVPFLLPDNGLISIPLTVSAIGDPGPHNLDLLAIVYPYHRDENTGEGIPDKFHRRIKVNVN